MTYEKSGKKMSHVTAAGPYPGAEVAIEANEKGGGATMSGCAYYEGYWMALEGAARESNPYEPAGQSIEWMSWSDGWEDAQDERRISDR
jgi:hypothetical protein